MQLTNILGFPSHNLTFDSRSNFFITASRSIVSCGSAAFFLEKNNIYTSLPKNSKIAATHSVAAIFYQAINPSVNYSTATSIPFSLKYLAAPAWKGTVRPSVAFSRLNSAPFACSFAIASLFSNIAAVSL